MKKSMKIIIIVVAAILAVAVVGALLYFGVIKNMGRNRATKYVDQMFKDLQTLNEEKIKEYMGTTESEDETEMFNDTEVLKVMFKNLQYEIKDSEGKKGNYTITASVSNKSLKEAFANYVQEAVKLAFQQAFGKITEEEMNSKLEEFFLAQYEGDTISTVTTEVRINVVKEDGEFKLQNEEEVMEAILPGYKDMMDFNESMVEDTIESTAQEYAG